MIKSVTIEGFKSFGSPARTVALGPLNFIVGANASGKTNFISALKFLRLSLLHGLDYTVNAEFGGCRETRNRVLRERAGQRLCCIGVHIQDINLNFKTAENRQFKLESATYRIEVDLRSNDANPMIVGERFDAHLSTPDGDRSVYILERDSQRIQIQDPTQIAVTERTEAVQPENHGRLSVASGFFLGRPATLFRDLVIGWMFFNINSQSAREPAREIPGAELGGHGENLAAVLHEIEKQNGRGIMNQILASLRGAVPQVQEIKPIRSDLEGKWSFQIVEERIRALNPASISDGTIRLLALLVAARWAAKGSSLLVIEEPENNLHPHLNEQLVATFRGISQDRQVLVTTHNPGFLDYLVPGELLLCEREKSTGFTEIVPASSRENIELFKRKYSLGELWTQGMLGGIPE